MSHDVPTDLQYLESHEWVREENGTMRIGISDFAQDELGDVVFVELPAPGATIEYGSTFGVVESIKAVSDLYAPVSGTVTATNEALEDRPELVNEDPHGEGWMLEIEPDDPAEESDLLDADAYAETIGE